MPELSIASTIIYSSVGAILLYQANRIYRTFNNYNAVKNFGYPIVIAPVTWQDPLWIIVGLHFNWLQHLPFCSWVKYSHLGWTTSDKGRCHQKYGPIFLIVSPNRTEYITSDPQTAKEVANKWKVWKKDQAMYGIFDVFGKNVNTTNGEDWQRHRKITGGAFRESNYRLVWNESQKQAKQMMQSFAQRSKTSMADLRNDVGLLAMHVLSGAAFGKSYEYGQGLKQVDAGHQMSYFAAMALILGNLMGAIMCQGLRLPRWLMPGYVKRMHLATSELKKYMTETVKEQRANGISSERHDLATQLLVANELAKDENLKSGVRAAHLTDDELFGNIFMFSFAGYETTAMSLCFTVPYLAMKLDIQDWVREELEWVKNDGQLETYEDAFPQLKRSMALMYETLRLHAPAALLTRMSPDRPTELIVPSLDKTLTIPAGSLVSIPITTLPYDRKTWGEDMLEYNPKRWISTNEKGQESLIPEADHVGYMPWMTGPRECPGKKFSQVEYLAVLSSILLEFDIKPAKFGNTSSDGDAVKALQRAVDDAYHIITPTMKNPTRCGVDFVRRKG